MNGVTLPQDYRVFSAHPKSPGGAAAYGVCQADRSNPKKAPGRYSALKQMGKSEPRPPPPHPPKPGECQMEATALRCAMRGARGSFMIHRTILLAHLTQNVSLP